MALDLTALNKPQTAERRPNQAAPPEVLTETQDKQPTGKYKDWLTAQEENEKQIRQEQEEKRRVAALRKDQDKSTNKFLLSVAKETQKNLQRGGTLVYEVNKAIRDDKPPEQVALLAVKCVSLLISEPLMFTTLEKKYAEQYGITLSTKWPFKVQKK